ncbi:hypothetical protein GCM10011339_35870 [Echinicola rosea]|uniref:Uncharacterized protein n=1 Tax=Echinicola rosea TaxID=1807691 RepID=A0ABQ1V9S1_9BACT|nr:hypothetical protein GCM10011339_35870 [Echinicola rosea]
MTVRHDHHSTFHGESKLADFFIWNRLTNKKFYWEHFGNTNSENYKEGIPEKIFWYKINGHKIAEKGGDLIYTYYVNENQFLKDIEKYINLIKAF